MATPTPTGTASTQRAVTYEAASCAPDHGRVHHHRNPGVLLRRLDSDGRTVTAREQTCYVLVCDECDAVYEDTEYGGPIHFESVEAIRFDATGMSGWSTDGERDLCPTCTCKELGHQQKVGSTGFVYCDRCDETLIDEITRQPNEAFL